MSRDLHVVLAGLLLAGIGGLGALLGLLMIPTGLLLGTTEPEFRAHPLGPWLGLAIGGMEAVLLGGIGASGIVAGAGVLLRRRWGWALAVALAGLALPSGCLPISAYVLWALLRAPVRHGFGVR